MRVPGLLRDRHRRMTLITVGALLVACVVRWSSLHGEGALGPAFLADPAGSDGAAAVLSLVRVEEVIGPDVFVVREGSRTVRVHGETSGLVVATEVTVGGVYDAAADEIRQTWRVAHPQRPAKKTLGLVALGFLAWGARRWFAWTPAGLTVRG